MSASASLGAWIAGHTYPLLSGDVPAAAAAQAATLFTYLLGQLPAGRLADTLSGTRSVRLCWCVCLWGGWRARGEKGGSVLICLTVTY